MDDTHIQQTDQNPGAQYNGHGNIVKQIAQPSITGWTIEHGSVMWNGDTTWWSKFVMAASGHQWIQDNQLHVTGQGSFKVMVQLRGD